MSKGTDFEKATQQRRQSLVGEFWQFLKQNKKWWLLPIVIVLGGISLLAIFAGGGAAPFIYTMF